MGRVSGVNSYGFVYRWHDLSRDMFYIGSHWGDEKDGYICSCKDMKKEYRLRPTEFTREILANGFTSRFELLAEEMRWLSNIPDSELGRSYYNRSKNSGPWWIINDKAREAVIAKMRGAKRGKPAWNKGITGVYKRSEEEKQKRSDRMKQHWSDPDNRAISSKRMTGRKHSVETIQKMRLVKKGSPSWIRGLKMTNGHKRGISEGNRRAWARRRVDALGGQLVLL